MHPDHSHSRFENRGKYRETIIVRTYRNEESSVIDERNWLKERRKPTEEKKESAVVERVKSLETRAPLYARTPDRILRLSRSPLFPLHVAHSARCNPDFQRPRFTFRICCRATFHGNCLERGGASGKQALTTGSSFEMIVFLHLFTTINDK